MSGPAHDFPWLPWGDEAFARARAEEKPILLHIGATWCHWCHVMDEGSYAHPGVARLLRERFVGVRVDTDERPDVNERYNQGGWPTVAVLDRDGEVLLGRTYVPGSELYGLLTGLVSSAGRWSAAPRSDAAPPASPLPVSSIAAAVDRAWDTTHGGFGELEKFPHPTVCEWLLDRAIRGDDRAAAMVESALDAMAGLGMYDQEEGGFFRYSTRDDWSVPHYEKLLEDHARLLSLYLRASAWRPHPLWDAASRAAMRWALNTLWNDAAGGFGGSQDADEDYHTSPLATRGPPPAVDRTVYAGWNGLMVPALVRAAAAWNRPGLLGIARRVGATLLGRVDGVGRVTRAGDVTGLLDDQVGVAEGLLALGAAEGGAWLDAAELVLAWTRSHLHAPDGGWLDRPSGGFGRLALPRRPLHGNAAYASACARLAALRADPTWRATAEEATAAALSEAQAWGFMAAPAGAIRERLDAPVVVVKVHGRPDLLAALLRDPRPGIQPLALDGPAAARQGLPHGAAQACTDHACARPSRDLPELERAIAMLLGEGPAPGRPPGSLT